MTRRGPGWPTVLGLMLAVVAFAVVNPLQLVAVPLAFLLVALPPRTPSLLGLAAGLLFLAFIGPHGPLWYAEHGWVLLVAGWFLLSVVVWPEAPFLQQAVAAVAGSTVTAGVIVALSGSWAGLDGTIAAHYRQVAEALADAWPLGSVDEGTFTALAGQIPGRLFPALLGVSSVAALGVAWWVYRRVSPVGAPLGRLPEFRFPDVWVWVLIVGLALLLAPLGDEISRVGSNLVLFMGALYALRGLAVLVTLIGAMAGQKVLALVALVVIGVMLYPIVVAGSLLLGVTDTWLDLRSGGRAVNDEG